MNIYAKVIIDEFKRRGIGTDVLDQGEGIFSATISGREYLFHESLSAAIAAPAVVLSGNKFLTNKYLKGKGFSVPEAKSIENIRDARAFMSRNGSIVLKPLVGEGGEGVIVDIASEQELADVFLRLSRLFERIYAEETVEGLDVRVLVIGFKVVAALQRIPCFVIGDGKKSILDLVKEKEALLRAKDPNVAIPLDDETKRVLGKSGLSLESILEKERKATVRLTANFHTGGTIHNITPELSNYHREIAVNIAEKINMPIVGIDFCIPKLNKDRYYILEVNERPNLAFHLYPESGAPIDTPRYFVDYFLENWDLKKGTDA